MKCIPNHYALLAAITLAPFAHAAPLTDKPKLILQLTIDQFAGNQLDRFKSHLSADGFAYLINHGYWYDNAHHPHATTQTAVGHSTLATGTVPAIHGIIANEWWDKQSKKDVYAFYDATYPIIGDHSAKKKAHGRSPANLLAPSFADLLAMATHGKSKRFAVSTKDRGAIPLAGHTGQAYWFDTTTGNYVTSRYYATELPSWLEQWNQQKKAEGYLGQQWQLKQPCATYHFCSDKLKHFIATLKYYKSKFPHPYGHKRTQAFFKRLTASPVADELTLDVSKELIKHENLGRGKETDYLSISLSATDAIGHTFGPNSIESEANFIELDKHLGEFFKFLDKQVGLSNTLIVLSADHGVAPSPHYLQQFHYPSVETSDQDILRQPAMKHFLKQYGVSWKKLVMASDMPDLYLNDNYLRQKGINKQRITLALCETLMQVPNIALAVPTDSLRQNRWNYPLLKQPLINQIHPLRSGDIYLVPQPFTYITNAPYTKVHHGTPWQYDTHVPIILAHPSIQGQRIHRKVFTTDIAPTLAVLAYTTPPATTTGQVLSEIF